MYYTIHSIIKNTLRLFCWLSNRTVPHYIRSIIKTYVQHQITFNLQRDLIVFPKCKSVAFFNTYIMPSVTCAMEKSINFRYTKQDKRRYLGRLIIISCSVITIIIANEANNARDHTQNVLDSK